MKNLNNQLIGTWKIEKLKRNGFTEREREVPSALSDLGAIDRKIGGKMSV